MGIDMRTWPSREAWLIGTLIGWCKEATKVTCKKWVLACEHRPILSWAGPTTPLGGQCNEVGHLATVQFTLQGHPGPSPQNFSYSAHGSNRRLTFWGRHVLEENKKFHICNCSQAKPCPFHICTCLPARKVLFLLYLHSFPLLPSSNLQVYIVYLISVA